MGEILNRFAKICCQNNPLVWPACREAAYCPGCCQMLCQQLTSLHGELFLSFTKIIHFPNSSSSWHFNLKNCSLEDAHKVLENRSGKVFLGHPVYTSASAWLCTAVQFLILCLLPFCVMYKEKQDLSVQSKNSVEKGYHLQILHVLFHNFSYHKDLKILYILLSAWDHNQQLWLKITLKL